MECLTETLAREQIFCSVNDTFRARRRAPDRTALEGLLIIPNWLIAPSVRKNYRCNCQTLGVHLHFSTGISSGKKNRENEEKKYLFMAQSIKQSTLTVRSHTSLESRGSRHPTKLTWFFLLNFFSLLNRNEDWLADWQKNDIILPENQHSVGFNKHFNSLKKIAIKIFMWIT